ncbi:hypothetical protein ALO52_200283 [Pseudomonas syringae pv. primulae]|uniref:TetR family transcriptional regulator n=1 Tax=Pseudomonas syringae pv. primulae TaxID=251707 RepID=A0A0P9XM68_9PSED|nr:hypothetical protein ALO52_200283 [Pseudomonas syringae pv. primulae]
MNLPSDGRLTVLQATFNVLPSLSFELIGMTRELLLCFAHLLETPLLHKAVVDCSSFWRIVNWLNVEYLHHPFRTLRPCIHHNLGVV